MRKINCPLKWMLLALAFLSASVTASNNTSEDLYSVQDEVFYFVLPDRFANGDVTNDSGNIPGSSSDHGFDATLGQYYHGGDLKGLTSKLDYIKGLGVTAIWMTPVFENEAFFAGSAGYHGYWIKNYMQVDPHLGTDEELRTLITEAHSRGIKIFFDIVFNHTADIIKFEQCHDTVTGALLPGMSTCPYRSLEKSASDPYVPFFVAGQEDAKSPAWLNDTQYYNNQGDSTFSGESSVYGDFLGLDDLKTSDSQVISGMVEVAKYWIREFDIDGYRLDTVKHVNVEFWQDWTPAILDYARSLGKDDFFIFGEVFDGDPKGLSYFTKQAKLPSVLDFGLYFPATRVFAGSSGTKDFEFTLTRDDLYTDADSDASLLLNFVSNHDLGRIGFKVQDQFPNASDEEKVARLKLANAFMFFARGVPVIYYGDEQGFVGGADDVEAREDMMPSLVDHYNSLDLIGTGKTTADDNFDTSHPVYQAISGYATLYQQHETLRRGIQFTRYLKDVEPGLMAFSRVGNDDVEYLVVFNSATTSEMVALEATANKYTSIINGTELNAVNGEIDIVQDGLSFDIFKAATPVIAPDGDYTAELMTPDVNGNVHGDVELSVIINPPADQPLPLNEVLFEARIGNGEYFSLGTDFNPDYKVTWDTSSIENGTAIEIKATVTTQTGQQIVKTKQLTVDVTEGMFIRFKKPANWKDVNIYFFDAAVPSPGWPGQAMRDYGDGWFSFKFPDSANSATIIFNDGNGKQTDNLQRQGDGCYADSEWSDDCDLPVTIYFEKPQSWGDGVRIHYWNSPPANDTQWPGELMTSRDEGWYSYTFTDGTELVNLVFNDGQGNQTTDFMRDSTGCYLTPSAEWVDECDLPAGPYGDELFIRGTLNNWDATYQFEYSGAGLYTTVVDLTTDRIEFKIASADWGVQLGGATDTEVAVYQEKLLVPESSSANLQLEAPRMANFTVNLDASDPSAPILFVFIPAPYAAEKIYLRSNLNGWGTDEELVYMGDGTYRHYLSLPQHHYEFKVATLDWQTLNFGVDNCYDFNCYNTGDLIPLATDAGNGKIIIPAEADYQVVVDAFENKLAPTFQLRTANSGGEPYQGGIYLVGSHNSWQFDSFFEYQDGLYSLMVDLDAGEYDFKVASEGWSPWNFGKDNGHLTTANPLTLKNNKSNFSALIAEDGTYRFTLDPSDDFSLPMLAIEEYEEPVPPPYGETELYIRGNMNGWQAADKFIYNNDGSYSVTLDLAAGNYTFKIADADWSSGTNFGSHFGNADGAISLNTTKLLQDQASTNLMLELSTDGLVTFTLVVSSSENGGLITEPGLVVSK